MKQGQQQQRYRVLERLAAGGMAEVYLAESAGIEGFKKRVAIKRVLPHLSEKKRFIAMFLDEARLSAHLSHSNVAQVFDIGVGSDNAYFIVMEYVDGSDLKSVIEFLRKTKRNFPVEVAIHIAEKICEGLSYAHEAKNADGQPLRIVHRDVSPANVLITKYGEVKIVDFGLAKATSQLEKSEPGIVKGKFGYLSPEAAQGIEVDPRTDVFAVGIILWEMLAQKRLFLGENDLATVMMVRLAAVPPLAPINKDVPPELEKVIQRALARDPEKRFQSARELGRALNELLFELGKPVGAHDVADLVSGTVALKKTSAKDKDTTVGKLIEAALLEFNSLGEEQSTRSGSASQQKDKSKLERPAPAPGRVSQFEDIGKWAEEIDVAPQSHEPRTPGSDLPMTRREASVATKLAESGPAATAKATPIAKGGELERTAKESAPAATLKATPKAKGGEIERAPEDSAPAATVKATPKAKGDESPAGESLPAATVKATPDAKGDEGPGGESLPAATMKATPNAKAEEGAARGAEATSAEAEAEEEDEDAPRTRRSVVPETPAPKEPEVRVEEAKPLSTKKGGKGKKRGAAKLSPETTDVVVRKKVEPKPANRLHDDEAKGGGKVFWIYVVAAVLLLAASAFYGKLFSP